MGNLTKNIQGTFYTFETKGVISGFFVLQNNYWICISTYESYFNLYLDRNKKVSNPKNEYEKEEICKIVLNLIDRYEKIINDYACSGNFKKVSPSFDMGISIANSYLIEYKKIYMDYFASNTIKYIFED